jgi:LmbE family N-acetylglucosaminyl deacetylase
MPAGFLVIAPHIDDEVLGCGGVLDERFHVHYCGVEEHRIISREERLAEAAACADFLGFTFSLGEGNPVNSYAISELVSQFESLIERHHPATVFLPYPSYNQDHRAVLDAALTALRPHDVNHFVRNVLLYEEIQVGGWPRTEDLLRNLAFQPSVFVPIDIEKKLCAYRLHVSQVRGMRSQDLLRSLAKWRGFQGNWEFAEAFQPVRLADPVRLQLGKLRKGPDG